MAGYTANFNAGLEQATVSMSAAGIALLQNNSRAFIVVQNCGTAVAGISFGNTNPTSLDQCSYRFSGASTDGGADGDLVQICTSLQPVAVAFSGTGTKRLQITEYS